MGRFKFQIIMGSLLGLAFIAILVLFLEVSKHNSSDGMVSGQVITTGQATIGGPFNLISHYGAPVTDTNFRGRHMLIFFGYSFCPDVCPLELQRMALVLDILDEAKLDMKRIQPLFISIDPERDSPDILSKYVPLFHPLLIGLTGSSEQIAEVATNYKVYYRRASDDLDYLMDHSAIVYFMGTEGEYLAHFTSFDSPEDMARRIQTLLE